MLLVNARPAQLITSLCWSSEPAWATLLFSAGTINYTIYPINSHSPCAFPWQVRPTPGCRPLQTTSPCSSSPFCGLQESGPWCMAERRRRLAGWLPVSFISFHLTLFFNNLIWGFPLVIMWLWTSFKPVLCFILFCSQMGHLFLIFFTGIYAIVWHLSHLCSILFCFLLSR